MSAELIEDRGVPNASLPHLQAPGTIAANDLATKLEAADADISDIQELLGKVRLATASCVRSWTISSETATSGAGGPSDFQSDHGGGGSRAERTGRLSASRRLR
jgi:hypothetical protein